jgi:uncharacterized membrane-anchored protein
MNRMRFAALATAIVFQGLILTGMVAMAALPLVTGDEIQVKTQPVDPRDMFRGQYVRLGYAFSRIERHRLPAEADQRPGEVVFVSLTRAPDGSFEMAGASMQRPPQGPYLRGRVRGRESGMVEGQEFLRIEYGIEAYFAPGDVALVLEDELRDGGVATLRLASNGRARITAVSAPARQ